MKLSPVRWVLAVAGLLVLGFLLIQLVPVGRDHNNPPVKYEPAWDTPRTEKLVRDACFDCHSNETRWPWYSNVAPMSWLVYHDVVKARSRFNFNDLTPDVARNWVGEMVLKIRNNAMPPMRYSALHGEARFSTAERQEIIDGLQATFK
jgi:hypothetical protein